MPEPQTGRIGGGVLQDNLELYQGGAGKPNLNFKNTASDIALLHLDPVTGRIGVDLENPSKTLTVNTKFRSENLNSDRTEVFPLFTIENNTVGVDTDILYLTATPTEAYTINWAVVAQEILRTSARIVVPLTDFLLSAAPDGYLYGDINLSIFGATPGEIPFGSPSPVTSADSARISEYNSGGTTGNATWDERLETVFVPALTELFETDPATYGYVFRKYYTDPNIQLSALATDDILIDDEKITTYNSNANLDLIPNGTGTVEFLNDVDVYGSMNATGNISMGGNLIFGTGPETPDRISFDTEVQSDIIPDITDTFNIGSSTRRMGAIYSNLLNGQAVQADSVVSGFVTLNRRPGNSLYVSTNGDDTNVGDHVQGPFRTLKRALEFADASDGGTVTIHIFAGEYEEELPLIVPDNVTVKGEELRNTIIKPAAGYELEDVFKLNDNSTVEDLTVKDFYSPGSAFSFATDAVLSTRSPYVRNVSVITAEGYVQKVLYPDQSGVTWFGNKYENRGYYGLNTRDYWGIGWFRSYGGYPASSYLKWVNKETGEEGSEDLRIGFGGNYGDAGSFVSNGFPAHNTFVIGEDTQVETVTLGFGRRSVPTPTGMSGISGSDLELGQVESLITTNYAALTSAYNTSAVVQDTINVYTLDSYANGQLSYSYSLELGVTKFVISDDYIVVGDNNGDVYDTATGTLQRNLGLPSNAGGTFAIEGSTFVNVESNTITVYDLNTGNVIGTKTSVPSPSSVNGNTIVDNYLFYRSGSSSLYRYDLRNLTKDADIYPFLSSDFETDGITLAAAYSNELKIAAFKSGSGATVDGGVIDSSSPTASMLFHSATFITPGVTGLYMTNGVRVEWLNSFTYFADKGLYAERGTTGHLSTDGSTIEYGAELRSIGSANVYGNYGAYADGADTIMYLINHNFAYIGTQNKLDNDPNDVIESQQWEELNSGKIYVTNTDEKGKFKVGNEFFVDLETGLLSLDAEDVSLDGLSQIVISDGTNETTLNTSFVETGNIRFEGETIYSLIGDLNIDSISTDINFNNNVLFDKNADVTGDLTIAGELIAFGNDPDDILNINVDIEQDFYPDEDRVYSLGSESRVWNDVYADNVVIDDIRIFDNVITTTISNANLNLQSNGAGQVQIEDTLFRENTIGTTSDNDLEFTLSGNFIVEGQGLKLATGLNNQRVEEEGALRFSSENNLFEGYGDGRISFDGVFSDDRRTSIIAHPTDNYIDINVNNLKVGEINNEGITLHGLQSDTVYANQNEFTTVESNSDLWIRRKGTGQVTLNGQEYFRNTTWTNPDPGAFEIISGEDGYVKIGGTLAVVVGLAGTTIEDNVNVLPKGTDVSASPLWATDNGVRIDEAGASVSGNGTTIVTDTQVIGSTTFGTTESYFIDFGISDVSDVIDIEISQIRFRGNFQDTNEYVDITIPDDITGTYTVRIGEFEDNGNTTDYTVSGVFAAISSDTRTYTNTGTEASNFATQVVVGGSGNYGINVDVAIPSTLNTLISGMTNNWELEIQYKVTTTSNQFVEYNPGSDNYYYIFDEDTSNLPDTDRYLVTDTLDLSNFTAARFVGRLILGDGTNGSRVYNGNDIEFQFSFDGTDDTGMITITPIMEVVNKTEFVIWKDFEIIFNIEDSTVDFSNLKFRVAQTGGGEKGANAFALTNLSLVVSEDSGPGPDVGAFRYNPSIKGVEVWNGAAWIPATGIEEDPVTEEYMTEEVSLWSILLG